MDRILHCNLCLTELLVVILLGGSQALSTLLFVRCYCDYLHMISLPIEGGAAVSHYSILLSKEPVLSANFILVGLVMSAYMQR